jgi:hypothetical protein
VQVAPIKPLLKAPGTKRFKLKTEKLLSNFGFKFSLRRYSSVLAWPEPAVMKEKSFWVGQCRLTLSNPR